MTAHLVVVVCVMGVVTFAARAAPFVFLGRYAERAAVRHLGRRVPPVILTLLVLYSLRNVSVAAPPYGLPEALSLGLAMALHLKWRNALLSIAAGTGLYMAIVQSGLFAGLG